MSIRLPADVPTQPTTTGTDHGARFAHGDLLAGKVTRVDPDGSIQIRIADIDVRTQGDALFQAGRRVFAHVQKLEDDTLLSLLPRLEEGDILSGTVSRQTASGTLARFGDAEIGVRFPSTQSAPPTDGTPIRAQVQLIGGKPVLQAIPSDGSGPILSGIVTADRGDGAISVDINGTTFIATTSNPVELGERVYLQMLQEGDRLILLVVPDASAGTPATDPLAQLPAEPQYARLLDALVAGNFRMNELGSDLLSLLQNFTDSAGQPAWAAALARALGTMFLDPHGEALAGQLADAFMNSGVFLEARLLQAALSGEAGELPAGDLKLALLLANGKLSEMAQSAPPAGGQSAPYLDQLATQVGRLLDAVTAQQMQNVRAPGSNEFYVQLPFAEQSGLKNVDIRISPYGKRAGRKIDPKNVLLTLAVATSNLGRVRAALAIDNGRVRCQFRVENEAVARLLTDNADSLRQGLEKLNYRVAYIDCMLSKSPDDLSVFDTPPTASQKGFDVRA
jgi:hypothetical protein